MVIIEYSESTYKDDQYIQKISSFCNPSLILIEINQNRQLKIT